VLFDATNDQFSTAAPANARLKSEPTISEIQENPKWLI
jgi:hypothetical protein